jgi:pantetheine-phosphate adenylyltransferase
MLSPRHGPCYHPPSSSSRDRRLSIQTPLKRKEKPMARRAIYPGSFDPLTNGHLDIVERACHIFDEVIVAILINPDKHPMFTVAERIEMLTEVVKPRASQIVIETFEGLLVEYARRRQAHAIIRGVRSTKDYEYELPMILMNRRLNPDVETVLLVASEENSYVSSSLIKEVFLLGGSIEGLVPHPVIERMKDRMI